MARCSSITVPRRDKPRQGRNLDLDTLGAYQRFFRFSGWSTSHQYTDATRNSREQWLRRRQQREYKPGHVSSVCNSMHTNPSSGRLETPMMSSYSPNLHGGSFYCTAKSLLRMSRQPKTAPQP